MPRSSQKRMLGVALALLFAGLLILPKAALRAQVGAAAIKLYLKDGSYQLVKSYEVRGDRVRYFSLERSEWEEVPVSMVDFDATQKGEAAQKELQKKQLQAARELGEQHYNNIEPTGFEIAPGFRLPTAEGVYAFDGERVVPMVQSSGEVVKDKKRFALSLALPAPLLKNRDLVVLNGAHAAVRFHATKPAFYVQFASMEPDSMMLIPVTEKKDLRIIEKVQSGIGVGKSGEEREQIPLERREIKPGLILLHPLSQLAPGEYALGELLSQKLNLEVWDFGIDGLQGK
jgi:hypothetical protein